MRNQKMLGFSFCFLSLFQAEDSFERLNFILPGSLLSFKYESDNCFEKEFNVLCKQSRFEKNFRKVKVKANELWVASSQNIARQVGSCESIYNSGNKLQNLRHIQKKILHKSSIISHQQLLLQAFRFENFTFLNLMRDINIQ